MQWCCVKEMRKMDSQIGMIQEFNSMRMLMWIEGDVWFYTDSTKMCSERPCAWEVVSVLS